LTPTHPGLPNSGTQLKVGRSQTKQRTANQRVERLTVNDEQPEQAQAQRHHQQFKP
jgi:hypothetical protein